MSEPMYPCVLSPVEAFLAAERSEDFRKTTQYQLLDGSFLNGGYSVPDSERHQN